MCADDAGSTPSIGFVLLSHRDGPQTLRLIRRLNRSFGDPPIVVHHDFDKGPFPEGDLPLNASLVRPHLPTGWGTLATVEAFLAGLALLMQRADAPDWFVSLSPSDYPIKSAAEIRQDLASSHADAFMDLQVVDPRTLPSRGGATTVGGVGSAWLWTAFDRWFGRDVALPGLARGAPRRTIRVASRRLGWTHGPFRNGFRCFGGEATITGNRRCARHLLDFHAQQPVLARHYRTRPNVDESYLHCIVGNAPGLVAVNDSRRYIDWDPPGAAHPKTLTVADLPRLLGSRSHFARKFDPAVDADVLDRLDAWLDRQGDGADTDAVRAPRTVS